MQARFCMYACAFLELPVELNSFSLGRGCRLAAFLAERNISPWVTCPTPLATMRSIPIPLTLNLWHFRQNSLSQSQSCLRCWDLNSYYRRKFDRSLSRLRMGRCCRLRSSSSPIPNSCCWSLCPTRLWMKSWKRSASNSVEGIAECCSSRFRLELLSRPSWHHGFSRCHCWSQRCFRLQAGSLRLRR